MTVEVHDSAFAPVAELFERCDHGAGAVVRLSIFQEGEEVLWAAYDPPDQAPSARRRDLQVLRSISKAVLAVLAAMAVEAEYLDLDAPVAEVWPEFASAGKQHVTGRHLLTHSAGLPVFDEPIRAVDALAWDPAVERLAAQRPRWEPGTGHGYHDLTFGWLVGEWLRRACGAAVGHLVEQWLRVPLDLDLWIGVPLDVLPRVRPLLRPPGARREVPFPEAAFPPTDSSVDRRTAEFHPDRSLFDAVLANPDLGAWEHTVEYLTAPVPSANAVGDAQSIARLFGALVAEVDGVRLLAPEAVERLAAVQADGPDLVVGWPRRYGTGVMLPDPTRPMGGVDSPCFGHYAQGGSLVFAHAPTALAFGYTTSADRSFLGADPRNAQLAAMALDCAANGT